MHFTTTRILPAVIFFALGASGCNSSQPAAATASTSSSSPSPATVATPAPSQDNSRVCALFSAVDAQHIMGVPMKPKPDRGAIVCMYEEVTARPNSIGPGTVALTLNQRNSKDDEDKAWVRLKEVRHLQAGQKNVQVLPGMGDEAFFTGNVEKGKVGVSAVIARKGSSDFAIDIMVLDYIASPDALKSTAKRIAGSL